ncbi:hypothetical protein L7F22_068945 [Adiantum nelumboides]|nr:hypothetical protein [Adiantum nelumboides]
MIDQQGQQGIHFDANTIKIFQAFALFMQQQQAAERREVSTTNALQSIVNKMDQFKGNDVSKNLRQYEKDMDINRVPTTDMLASFELIVVLEIRAHIREIRGDHEDDWGAFSRSLKQEYFMEDSERVTKFEQKLPTIATGAHYRKLPQKRMESDQNGKVMEISEFSCFLC